MEAHGPVIPNGVRKIPPALAEPPTGHSIFLAELACALRNHEVSEHQPLVTAAAGHYATLGLVVVNHFYI